jgi:Fe2+ or Zn2+ uptake regulation protein
MLTVFASQNVDMSQATLYQNLVHLHRAGVIRKFLDSQGIARYDSNMHDHDHLICSRCGAMVDLDPIDRHALSIKLPLGWTIENVVIDFKGLCPKCQQAS